jgi:hypothetical protein
MRYQFCAAIAGSLLAACVQLPESQPQNMSLEAQRKWEERQITVLVIGAQVVVPEDIAYMEKTHKSVLWSLYAIGNNNCKFPASGIVFDPAVDLPFGPCSSIANGAKFQCPRPGNHKTGALFKYTVNVTCDDQPQPLDPWISNR